MKAIKYGTMLAALAASAWLGVADAQAQAGAGAPMGAADSAERGDRPGTSTFDPNTGARTNAPNAAPGSLDEDARGAARQRPLDSNGEPMRPRGSLGESNGNPNPAARPDVAH